MLAALCTLTAPRVRGSCFFMYLFLFKPQSFQFSIALPYGHLEALLSSCLGLPCLLPFPFSLPAAFADLIPPAETVGL